MASTVIHFGISDCARLRVLTAYGYQVYDCGDSFVQLQDALHHHHADAVVFSEQDSPDLVTKACDISARICPAPRILFTDSLTRIHTPQFHAIIEPQTSPRDWLGIIEATIEQTRALISRAAEQREHSRQLCDESAEVRSNSQEVQARSRGLRLKARYQS